VRYLTPLSKEPPIRLILSTWAKNEDILNFYLQPPNQESAEKITTSVRNAKLVAGNQKPWRNSVMNPVFMGFLGVAIKVGANKNVTYPESAFKTTWCILDPEGVGFYHYQYASTPYMFLRFQKEEGESIVDDVEFMPELQYIYISSQNVHCIIADTVPGQKYTAQFVSEM